MSNLGSTYADALVGMMVVAFIAGMVAIGALWLLWHFVFSHITVGWV